MDIERAKELLSTLADGVNPLTGEVLSDSDSCNQVEVVRALHTVLHELESLPKRKDKNLPENTGKPWTAKDEAELCKMFDSGAARKELCDHFKRTSGAITSRLVRLGKLHNTDEFWRR
mgnify:CR=1 FL=1